VVDAENLRLFKPGADVGVQLRALASSQPKGFSITSRGQFPAALTFKDDLPSWTAMAPNRRGGVAR
jgi:hypothetical protein